jgi:hypothetical protein
MASDICFRCGADLPRGAGTCTNCGATVSGVAASPGRELHPLRIVGYICATILFLLVLVYGWGQLQSSTSQAQHNTDVQIQQWASSSP